MQPPASDAPRPAPRTTAGVLAAIGPGLIISANIVGSGELIVTTRMGAAVGFTLLWFIVFSCFIKVFVQIELGRYAVSRDVTTLEALDSLPGPRLGLSWILWLWLLMYLGTLFQVSGMLGAIASLFAPPGSGWPHLAAVLLPAVLCAALLGTGRYGPVERVSTAMVALFTLATVGAGFALQWTPYGLELGDLVHGFSFHRPESFTVAFAAFGVTGVGASELIFYPYWCLEKGYGRHVGPWENTPDWLARARGWLRVMRVDAWISMAIYTLATVAFYLLGAAVLNRRGLQVEDAELIPTLSRMYSETLGPVGVWVFLAGAFAVLFSTVFVSTASNARLLIDAAAIGRLIRSPDPERRRRLVGLACYGLVAFQVLVYLLSGRPVLLVMTGALAQALMLPFLAMAALYFRHRRTREELRPGGVWTTLLWVSFLSMLAVGVYQFFRQVQSLGGG